MATLSQRLVLVTLIDATVLGNVRVDDLLLVARTSRTRLLAYAASRRGCSWPRRTAGGSPVGRSPVDRSARGRSTVGRSPVDGSTVDGSVTGGSLGGGPVAGSVRGG